MSLLLRLLKRPLALVIGFLIAVVLLIFFFRVVITSPVEATAECPVGLPIVGIEIDTSSYGGPVEFQTLPDQPNRAAFRYKAGKISSHTVHVLCGDAPATWEGIGPSRWSSTPFHLVCTAPTPNNSLGSCRAKS